jgi:hypothetical protein
LGTGGKAQDAECLTEPIGHLCPRLNKIRKPFGKNATSTESIATEEAAHNQFQDDELADLGKVGNCSQIMAMYGFGCTS